MLILIIVSSTIRILRNIVSTGVLTNSNKRHMLVMLCIAVCMYKIAHKSHAIMKAYTLKTSPLQYGAASKGTVK